MCARSAAPPHQIGSGPAGPLELWETIPATFEATGFSPTPDWQVAGDDGSTVYGWAFSLQGRVTGAEYEDTWYDRVTIRYDLRTLGCAPQVVAAPIEGYWLDAAGSEQTSSGGPLLVECGE